MNRMKRYSFLLLAFIIPLWSSAQCSMCRAVIESGQDDSLAEGINNGIVYLMAVPYILVGVLFFFVYRKMKRSV